MCTVTFIPTPTTCYITSNRDESPGRQAPGLTSRHTMEWNAIHFPLDEMSGGSWIALSDSGRVVCLLNGAFEAFKPEPSYRLSRGQVVMDLAFSPDPHAFFEQYKLEGVAPFTILLYDRKTLYQWVWDGQRKYIEELSADQPQIWSSVTLYPYEVRARRKSMFDEWLRSGPIIDRESIIAFHQMANGDPHNDFVMNRDDIVKTLSITSVLLTPESGSILHLSLDRESREEIMVSYGA